MKKSIEITIPVYNEEKELERNIGLLHSFCEKNIKEYSWHITIADNASSDNTPIIGETLSKKLTNTELFRLEQKGRGRAVKRAWSKSNSDLCVYMDLDLSTDLIHLPELISRLENGSDIVIGSRLLPGSKVEGRTLLREITSRTLNFIFIRVLFQTKFTDAQCGFKGVTRRVVNDLLPHIKDNDWFFDGELLIVGTKSGYKLHEIPVHWVDNPGSTVRLLSTIFNDLEAMFRLLRTKPWREIRKK